MNNAHKKELNRIIKEISKQVNTLYEPIPEEYKNINIDDPTFLKQMQEMKELEDLIDCLEDSINE